MAAAMRNLYASDESTNYAMAANTGNYLFFTDLIPNRTTLKHHHGARSPPKAPI
jgi:hypothetical protein